MAQKSSWLSWPLEHYPISILIIGILFFLGIFGMYDMPKDEFPPFTIRKGVVAAVYPGATSEEVEAQVSRPLERYLFTFEEVNREKTTTTAENGLCIVMVTLNDNIYNKDEVWSKIKHGLNAFKPSLPAGVLALVTKDDFGSTSALLISIESKQRSYRELQDYSDRLSDRLRRIESVANVRPFGEQKEQISLYVDRQRLQAYGVGQQLLFSRLQSQGITSISGSIDELGHQFPIYVDSTEKSEEEIANQIIFSEPAMGKIVRVCDIADIVREYDNNNGYIEQDGHPCILLSLEMIPGNNIVAYGREVDKVLNEFRRSELPEDVTITRIADQPRVVSLSVTSFLRDLLISMAIIILVMMLLFPLRSAIVAAITIPLSTFISVSGMFIMGIELNIVTLAALIVVLGMVVDNSIVVIDGYLEYLGKGMAPKEAAIKSAKQYFMPMMLATMCICIIFFPLLLTMKGAFHDALEDFPMTITINLMVSLILAVMVIPFLEVLIIKPEKMAKKDKEQFTDKVQRLYEKVLGWTFRRPWLTICIGIASVAVTCLLIPALKFRLFPYADRDQFAVEIFLPDGKGLGDTREVSDSLRNVLLRDERVKCVTSFVGCSSPRFMTCYAPQIAGKNFAQFIVNTTSQDATLSLLADYQPAWAEAFPQAYIRFKRLDYLEVPELEYRFYGDNLDSLHTASERMMEKMRSMPDLEWIHTDFMTPYPIVNVELDPVTSAQLGITRTTAAMALSVSTNSLRVGQLWEGDYELPIVVKDTSALTFSDIENIGVTTPMTIMSARVGAAFKSSSINKTVPLRQIATVTPKWSESKIQHRGGERCITVTAQFAQGVYAKGVEDKLAELQEEIDIPEGVRTEVGGEIEYNNHAVPQIVGGIAIAMVIVFFFLLFNFKKYGISIICIVALAFMVPGTMIGLTIMNRTLGLTSVLGLITLMGMIMRNEILIFEHAGDIVKKFTDSHPDASVDEYNNAVKEAAFDAGRRRMVPIFLTTATTAVGVVPMIIAATSFWMPVGVTIFAGGIGALILVVTMLPVIYWKISSKKKV